MEGGSPAEGVGVGLLPYSGESRIGAGADFLEPVQPRLPMCLNCGESAFFVASCWLSWLSFALAPTLVSPDYTAEGVSPELLLSVK